jgi:hypothetical protein
MLVSPCLNLNHSNDLVLLSSMMLMENCSHMLDEKQLKTRCGHNSCQRSKCLIDFA